MNAIALIAPNTFEDWLEQGRQLATLKRELGFRIGDWARHGLEAFPEQFELALEQAGMDRRAVTKAASVAKAFPPHMRNEALSFDHHQAVLVLPREEQLNLLKKAGERKWKPRELKDAVIQRRYERGDDFPDEDVDSYLQSEISRAWNRATPAARRGFFELATEVDFGVIDEDVVHA
jgi:hypothetical protein